MVDVTMLYQSVLDRIKDGVYFVDTDRRITYWNAGAEELTGYTSQQMIGQLCMANLLMHVDGGGEQLCLGACPLAQTLRDRQERSAEVYLHHADGHRVPVAVKVTAIEENGVVTGAVETFTENTSMHLVLERIQALQREALLDELTGVGNRRMIGLRLAEARRAMQQGKPPFGVLMVDIDHFKQINDTYGHETGDRVLKMVIRSLSGGLRTEDFIGRWGGDELIVLLAEADEEILAAVAERLRMLVDTSLIFLDENDRRVSKAVFVTISVGGALARADESNEELLNRADRNLYQSKARGRNQVTL